jgi:hypothetical protein
MIYSFVFLVTGIYFGQEYSMYIPNIKIMSLHVLSFLQRKYIEENDKIQQEKIEQEKSKSWLWFWN